LCFLGDSPRLQDRIQCSVNGAHTSALPDTGSDLMFVSGEFARRNGWKVFRGKRYRRQVQRIDGSFIRTDGMVLDAELQFDMPSTADTREINYHWFVEHAEGLASLVGNDMDGSLFPGKMTFISDLHVIEGLPCDIILSNEFIFNNQIFSRFQHLFSATSRSPHALQGDINHTGTGDTGISDVQDSLLFMRMKSDKFSRLFSRQQRSLPPSTPNTTIITNTNNNISLQSINTASGSPQTQIQTKMQIWQAKWVAEESRRNHVQLRIESLTEHLKTQEERAEVLRQTNWDRRHPRPCLQSTGRA
jgi:hypothetical protein